MSRQNNEKRKVGVIGAGLGGLSCAIRLAHAGFAVTVFEKNERAENHSIA
jgi:phytoene dehydrogenase-like protein